MKNSDRKMIIIFLIVIIILSIILLYKVNRTPQYNEQLYSEVYAEYNEILNNIDEVEDSEAKYEIQTEEVNKDIESMVTINDDENGRKKDRVIALIRISKLHILYPVIENTTMENLKVAPTRLAGGEPNEIGNLCIIGHNMRNNEQFSNLKKLKKNDTVEILNTDGTKLKYEVYDTYTVKEDDLSCTSQDTNGKREVTLITCTNNKKKRLVVKCREV